MLGFIAGDYEISEDESTKWATFSFEDLSEEDRINFFSYKFVVRSLPDISDEEIRSIFQRINKNKSVMNWCKFYLKSRKHVGHISLIFIVCLLFWPKFKTLYRWHKMAAKRFMKNCLPSEMGLPHIKEKAMTIRNLTIQTLCCTLPEFEILLT